MAGWPRGCRSGGFYHDIRSPDAILSSPPGPKAPLMPAMIRLKFLFLIVVSVSAVSSAQAAGPGPVSFNRQIRPILSENCLACHGFDPKHREAGLRLDTFEGATGERDGVRAIVPGDVANSELWRVFRAMIQI